MTTDTEKQFFETFGIEETSTYFCESELREVCPNAGINCVNCKYVNMIIKDYPAITDRILLELICVLNKHYSEHYQIASMIVGKNIEEVKKSILNDCIEQSKHKDFKQQVQTLFKENN